MEDNTRSTLLDLLELTGRARTHIVQLERPRCALHRDAVEPFLALRDAAAQDGIDIAVFSAFRDFAAQAVIWNRKYAGERPLYDPDGELLDHRSLSEEQLIEAILSWSALPGASRHHWGSDMDVFDAAAVDPDYRVQLLPAEFASGGPFARLDRWLARHAGRFGFFRPYDRDRGGVQPEPWHLSYAPVSSVALELLTPELIAAAAEEIELLGRAAVLPRLGEIFQRYVLNVTSFESAGGPPLASEMLHTSGRK